MINVDDNANATVLIAGVVRSPALFCSNSQHDLNDRVGFGSIISHQILRRRCIGGGHEREWWIVTIRYAYFFHCTSCTGS